jgi:hypothetical protein
MPAFHCHSIFAFSRQMPTDAAFPLAFAVHAATISIDFLRYASYFISSPVSIAPTLPYAIEAVLMPPPLPLRRAVTPRRYATQMRQPPRTPPPPATPRAATRTRIAGAMRADFAAPPARRHADVRGFRLLAAIYAAPRALFASDFTPRQATLIRLPFRLFRHATFSFRSL